MMSAIDKIKEMTEGLLVDTDMFIVSLAIKPTNNVKLYLDADEGLSVQKSSSINRQLRKLIEDAEMFPEDDYSLEVSSPGIDEPLTSKRQYLKNIGRTVLVIPIEGTEVTGILKAVDEEKITLEVKQPKKKEAITVVMPLDEIKQTIVQIVF